ncbi:sulfatase family protein [Membranihabitans marinus]|uniref:sulfatase family protein n=1 Tax=Membranihabitans marinus TaxID=1227546 RepID=UPI001F2803BE|nr:arylsulfatase [Membranihabitans marinus]
MVYCEIYKVFSWRFQMIVILSLMLGNYGFSQSKQDLPNIVIIFADDLGYGDLQCYNPQSLIPTPHLDQLASEGIRLTDAYCPVSVCSPSRYALMTGQYPWKSWKKTGVMRNYEPSMMDSSILTLPEMLQKSGYHTFGLGKWHLGTTFPTFDGEKPVGYGQFKAEKNGANIDLSKPVTDGPLDHGFDEWYGFSCASECWILDNDRITGAIHHDLYNIDFAKNTSQLDRYALDEYTPVLTQKAIDFLTENSQRRNPFFMYFSPYVPHIPISVSSKFKGKTKAGSYGDYVHELDHYIGQILESIDRLGLKENTIVLFASDNGSQFEITNDKMDLSNAVNNREKQDVDDVEYFHTPNGGLRGTKWTVYEGGVRTPLIVRWPGKIEEGQVNHNIFGLIDVFATLGKIIDYPLSIEEMKDSKDLSMIFLGGEGEKRQDILVRGSGAVYGYRMNNWKYIPENQSSNIPESLFDLKNDPGEQNNLIDEKKTIAQMMRQKYSEILN